MNIYAGINPGEDPMAGLQKRMMEKREKQKNYEKYNNYDPPINENEELKVIKI